MEKHIFNEQNGLYYTLHGDVYLPDLVYSQNDYPPLGKLVHKNAQGEPFAFGRAADGHVNYHAQRRRSHIQRYQRGSGGHSR